MNKVIEKSKFIDLLKSAQITTHHGIDPSESKECPDTGKPLISGIVYNEIIIAGEIYSYHNGYEYPEGLPDNVRINDQLPQTWWRDKQSYDVYDDETCEELSDSDIFELIEDHTDYNNFDTDLSGLAYFDISVSKNKPSMKHATKTRIRDIKK